MRMQRFLDKAMGVGTGLILLAGIALVARIVYQVASGHGLESFAGGTRGATWTWLSALVVVVALAIVVVIGLVAGWFRRRRGELDVDE
jgi:uncharacterized membrane protein